MPCYHIGNAHICISPPAPWSDWKTTHTMFRDLEAHEMVFTDCCACWMRADQTKTRQQLFFWPFNLDDLPWYPPSRKTVCLPGEGCNANPRRKIGAYLREACHYG